MANPSAAWKAGHPWASVYDFFVERESLAGLARINRLSRSPALPRAYRFVLGDNAEIAIL